MISAYKRYRLTSCSILIHQNTMCASLASLIVSPKDRNHQGASAYRERSETCGVGRAGSQKPPFHNVIARKNTKRREEREKNNVRAKKKKLSSNHTVCSFALVNDD